MSNVTNGPKNCPCHTEETALNLKTAFKTPRLRMACKAIRETNGRVAPGRTCQRCPFGTGSNDAALPQHSAVANYLQRCGLPGLLVRQCPPGRPLVQHCRLCKATHWSPESGNVNVPDGAGFRNTRLASTLAGYRCWTIDAVLACRYPYPGLAVTGSGYRRSLQSRGHCEYSVFASSTTPFPLYPWCLVYRLL